MAVRYNRHRQKVDLSKHDSEKICLKYINKHCSPSRVNSGNNPSHDKKTIIITVKTKANTEQKKLNAKQTNLTRRRKNPATSFITIDDYLKVLLKKRSTPDVQRYVSRNHTRRRCSDTCMNSSIRFKTKAVVNTVSLDPKRVPPGCKTLLKHPLMQAQLSIYRCQLRTEKEGGCRTCTSAAIFEVVKCLYDCYKKKKCDPCKCVVCGYLPKDLRKVVKEAAKASTSVGVVTAAPNRKTVSTMTSQEDELLSMLQNEPQPERPKITTSEKIRIAKAFGIMTPAEVNGKCDKQLCDNHNTEYTTKHEPCEDENSPIEKILYRTDQLDEAPTVRVPSKKLRKARASGLLTPLEGKTLAQREKMLRILAMNNIPLPEGKTESERAVIAKVRRYVGLPPGPANAAEKERYSRAHAAGLITPLKGKSLSHKENILRSLLEYGIPLPEGRTPAEKALIEKIELDSNSRAMFRIETEKTIKSRAKSYMQTLFNKFGTEAGYMVLVETPCAKDKFEHYESTTANKTHKLRPRDTKSPEKVLFKEVEVGVRLVPPPQGKTLIGKLKTRGTDEKSEQTSPKKSINKTTDSTKLIEERITKPKEKLLPCIAIAGNPFLKSKISLENFLFRLLKDKAIMPDVPQTIQKPKGSKSVSEQGEVVKRETKDNDIERDTSKVNVKDRQNLKTSDVGKSIPQKKSKGVIANLPHLKENLDNIPSSAVVREKSVTCDMKGLSYRNSYLRIKLSLSDVSSISARKKTCSVCTDTKGIIQTHDKATSLPPLPNLANAIKVIENSNKTLTKNNINSDNVKYHTFSSTNSKAEVNDSKSTFSSNFVNGDEDNENQSRDNIYVRNFEGDNADLIYIYKPTLEVDGSGKLTASSRIILTDSYNVTPISSGSLYLIETGSTTTYDSTVTNFSCATTRDTSEVEIGTDVYCMKRSKNEHSKEISSEPRIFWFYRNKVTHNLPGNDAKIYLVSEVKARRQRTEPAQRTKKQPDLNKPWNGARSSDVSEVMTTLQPQNRLRLQAATRRQTKHILRRSSSVFIVMSPSDPDDTSSEELDSLIYIGKLDSFSELKNIKFVPHENKQNIDPCNAFRRHTRTEERGKKDSVGPSAAIKCSGIGYTCHGHASHALPVTNAWTRNTTKGTHSPDNRADTEPPQKPRIPPRYLEQQRTTTGRATWNRALDLNLSTCSTNISSRLCSLCSEKRECLRNQERKNLEININKTETGCRSKGPGKGIARYLYCGKSGYKETPNLLPNKRLVTKSSKVCLISTAHSSRYKMIRSRVSFSDELRYMKRERETAACNELCLDPDPTGCPPKNPKECVNSNDDSSCCSYTEKDLKKRDKKPQLTIKVKVSKNSLKPNKSNKSNKVRFGPYCCPCDPPRKGPTSCDEDKTVSQKISPCSCKDSKSCPDSKKNTKKNDNKTCKVTKKDTKSCDNDKIQTKPCENDKKESKPCDEENKELKSCPEIKESQPCDDGKKETKPCDKENKSSQPCDEAKKVSKPCDDEQKEQKPCDNEKNEPKPCDTEQIEIEPCDKEKKDLKPCDQVKRDSKICDIYKKISKLCDRETKEPKSCEVKKQEPKPCESEEKESTTCDHDPKSSHRCCRQKKKDSKCDLIKKISETFGRIKKKGSTGTPTCQRDTKERPCEDETEQIVSECSPDSYNENQSSLPKECKAQCSVIAKDVKSAEVDSSGVCQPSTLDQSKAICQENNITPETCRPEPCPEASKVIEPTREPATTCIPTSEGQASSNQDSNAERIKQQMVTEQLCPPNSTINEQATDECQKLLQQNVIECPEYINQSQQNALNCLKNANLGPVELPAAECIKQEIVTEQWCPPNATPNEQFPDQCAEMQKQLASECPASSTQDQNIKPDQQTANECPTGPVQVPTEPPVDECVKLNQQKAPESLTITLLRDSGQSVCKQESENVSTSDTPPCQAEEINTMKRKSIIKPRESKGSECIPKWQDIEFDENVHSRDQSDLDTCPAKSRPMPCTEEESKEQSGKKGNRLWWCKKKNQARLRRHSPPPPRPVEHTAETQCERNVRDLAQMTDSLAQITNSLRDSAYELAKCHCGDTVKPCQCLQDLVTRASNRPEPKPTQVCECPPPILLIKGQTTAKQNEKDVDSLKQMIEQKNCPCLDYLDKHNLKLCQCAAKTKHEPAILSTCVCKKSVCECPPPRQPNDTIERPTKRSSKCKCSPPTSQNDGCSCESKKSVICECKLPTPDGQADRGDKKKTSCECLLPKAAVPNEQDKMCPEMATNKGNKKNVSCECPRPTATGQGSTCPGKATAKGDKTKIVCECPEPKAAGQSGQGKTCPGKASEKGDKKNVTCECPPPTAAGQNGKDGTCQGAPMDSGDKKNSTCQCPKPTNKVTEQTTPVPCKKEPQASRDTLDTVKCKETQPQNKKQPVKKTVICEKPMNDQSSPVQFKLPCADGKKSTCLSDHKPVSKKKKYNISLGKTNPKSTAPTSSDECPKCSHVKWCQKKYVISECPPLPAEDECDKVCLSSERKKQQKKNAKNQAQIKTGEKKVDTSCTHGAAPCLCKDDPMCKRKKNHKCECPCPSYVEEVDLNRSLKDCPLVCPPPPCPPKEDNPPPCPVATPKKICPSECDQEQMTENKIDKSSYTDRPVKGLCKTKNRASGHGKWGKKQIECVCLPDPPTTERGCDPPCVKEQWRMKSRETHSKSGFSVKKKPAPRVDHTMCFEDALAYFEEHPEDDPMRKKMKKVTCECPPVKCCDSYGSEPVKYC